MQLSVPRRVDPTVLFECRGGPQRELLIKVPNVLEGLEQARLVRVRAHAVAPVHAVARPPHRAAAVAELCAAYTRHVRAPAVALDELLARRTAHPPELAPEPQRRAVTWAVRALVLVRRKARVDVGFTPRARACAAGSKGAGEDAHGDVLVPRAEEVAAAWVRAVHALWGVVLGLARREGLALGGGEVAVEEVLGDVLTAAPGREGGNCLERRLNERKKAVGVILVSARDEDRVVVHEPDARLAGYALVGRAALGISKDV